jgi:hypothetical protein
VDPNCIETDDLRFEIYSRSQHSTAAEEMPLALKCLSASMHLFGLDDPDDAPYTLSLDYIGSSTDIAMDGPEEGFLMAIPAPAVRGLVHRA